MTAKKRILLWVTCLLLAAGLVFLGLSIFSGVPGNRYLPAALGCIACSNLLTVLMMNRRNRK